MSTILLGQLSKPVQPAYAERVRAAEADERKHWVEALAAIVPAEALAATIAILALFTVKEANGDASLSQEGWVRILSLIILLAIPIVYAASSGKLVGKPHVIRWVAAMVAFAAWLWLLPLSVWDTFNDIADMNEAARAATGIVAALVIASGAAFLFKRFPAPTT